MERNHLELACNSLFIEKIKNAFRAAEVDRLDEVDSFSKQRTFGSGSVGFKADERLIDQDADAITAAGALLTSLLWQHLAETDEIKKHFGWTIASAISDLNSLFSFLKTSFQGKFP